MADPVVIECPHDTWTKVATNVQTGYITIMEPEPKYYQTYRLTGEAAPTNLSDAVEFVEPGMAIDAYPAIDVYIYVTDGTGSVRVDV